MTRSIDEVDSDLQTTKTQVPTLEDVFASTVIDAWPDANGNPTCTFSGSYAATLMVAPKDIRILSMAISCDYWNQPGNDTSFWTCEVKTGNSASGYSVLATRTTQITGALQNGGITARMPWTFDSAPWADVVVSKGNLLLVRWSPTGSVVPQRLPIAYSYRYRRA